MKLVFFALVGISRRAAVVSIVGAPAAARAIANPWDKGDLSNLKPEKERKRLRPDGFGGYVERDEAVAPVITKVIQRAAGDDDDAEQTPPAKAVTAAPRSSKPKPSERTTSSTPTMSLEAMVEASIKSKEESQGGLPLSDAEKATMRAKVEAMFR